MKWGTIELRGQKFFEVVSSPLYRRLKYKNMYISYIEPPGQVVKLIWGARFRAAKRRSRVGIPGVRLFPAKISDAVFSPNFHVIHVFREQFFALHKGIQADARRIRSS